MVRKTTCSCSLSRNHFCGQMASTVIFSLHVLSTALVLAQDGTVTCDVPSVEPLKNTFLTCHFPEDVSQTRRDFTVQLLKGKESQEPASVLDCWWVSGKLECFLWPGYKYDMTISDRLSVEFLGASTAHTGIYACPLANMDPKDVKTCEFHVKPANRTTCEIPSADLNSEALLTCYFPEDISQTKANFAVYHYSRKGLTDAAVSCEWKGDNLNCNTLRGYLFDHSVTDHLTLTIPSVTESNEGSYSCQIKDNRRVSYDTCSFVLQTATASSCNALSVQDTEPATLTCTFNVDVNVTRSHFRVVRLRAVGTKDDEIVVCVWMEDRLVCSTAPGYEVNNVVTDRVIVSMPRAVPEQNGTYACYLLGSRLDNFQPCEFIVMTATDADSFSPVTIGVVVTLIPLTLIIVVVVFVLKRRSRKWPDNEADADNIPLMSQDKAISRPAQTFWLQWVQEAFPDLDSGAYFLPRVPAAPGKVGHPIGEVLLLPDPGQSPVPPFAPVRDSDVRDEGAMQRVLFCLQKMSEKNREVLVGLSQLQFGQYLGEPCYAAAATCLPLQAKLPPPVPRNMKAGDFDVLLIHRQFGFIVCQVKTVGNKIKKLDMSEEDTENIRKELKDAVSHLDKAQAMLSHLVSDIALGLRITKTIAVPNLTARQVLKAISGDPQLTQDLCRCLETTYPAAIPGLCLCSDQLSDPRTPRDVSSDVLRELGNWWQRRVAVSGPDSHMTFDLYKTLAAWFCGPATTVTVPCTSPPRLCVKTLGQTVSLMEEFHSAEITLFPEQVDLLNTAPPRLFVAGPPGTGKTVVLLLKGIEWLRCGNHVYILSIWFGSRAACIMLYHLLRHIVETQLASVASPSQLHLVEADFADDKNVEKTINDLSQAASGGSLYVIADGAGPEPPDYLQNFCDKLLTKVPGLHLWAASCYHRNSTAKWPVAYLTRPLRSPTAVVMEVQQDEYFSRKRVHPYSERAVSDHTDGPPVKRVSHRPGEGHSGDRPLDCSKCGREVASFLHSLRYDVPDNTHVTSSSFKSASGATTQPCLQWRDMLVLPGYKASDTSGAVEGLREAGIPVRVMTNDDTEDVVTARSDVVWVADRDHVRGLERKVVVCLGPVDAKHPRLHLMSRCSAQLVIVSREA